MTRQPFVSLREVIARRGLPVADPELAAEIRALAERLPDPPAVNGPARRRDHQTLELDLAPARKRSA